ncbi:MAG: hypothetical protein IJ428_02470 [Clostridia bacterium]|nr:hypothetical protein [Clostridia bacterium]
MKVKVLCAKGYNYEKNGVQKQGMTLDVCSATQENDSDGRGNFTCGYPAENIYIPRSLPIEANDLINLVGKEVELVYERKLGQKFEQLVDIKVLD